MMMNIYIYIYNIYNIYIYTLIHSTRNSIERSVFSFQSCNLCGTHHWCIIYIYIYMQHMHMSVQEMGLSFREPVEATSQVLLL